LTKYSHFIVEYYVFVHYVYGISYDFLNTIGQTCFYTGSINCFSSSTSNFPVQSLCFTVAEVLEATDSVFPQVSEVLESTVILLNQKGILKNKLLPSDRGQQIDFSFTAIKLKSSVLPANPQVAEPAIFCGYAC